MKNVICKVYCTTNLFIKKRKYIKQSMKYHTIWWKINKNKIYYYIYYCMNDKTKNKNKMKKHHHSTWLSPPIFASKEWERNRGSTLPHPCISLDSNHKYFFTSFQTLKTNIALIILFTLYLFLYLTFCNSFV